MAPPGTSLQGVVTLLHTPLAKAISRARTDVVLCSPFLGAGTAHWLAAAAAKSGAEWSLLTVLDPVAAAYGSLFLDGLRALAAAGVTVRHADALHAKAFLIDGSRGWAGSANLTASGLGENSRPNLELTVEMSAAQVAQTLQIISAWVSLAKPTTGAMIDECAAKAALIPTRTSTPPGKGRTAAKRSAAGDRILQDALHANIWIKAVYQDAARADAGWALGSFVTSSKRGKPSFVNGDLLLVYAKQAKTCNAVLEVKGATYVDRREQLAAGISAAAADRWPWITPVSSRLHVPSSRGIALGQLGLTGRSLQGGHCRMPIGGIAAAVRHMT
jgi:hypothetical protein